MNDANANALVNGTGLKTAVVGIGNAGGQVALAAAKKGFNVFVMNTSVKDLDDSVIGKSIKAHRIGDGRGSGKNRENAMELLKNEGNASIKEIFANPYFKDTVEPADVVFVTFSTGGGTGSGIGPEIARLIHRAYSYKVVIPYGILPKNSESVVAQSNTIACADDMTKIGTPFMLADLSFYENAPQEESFKKIADYMVETMAVVRGDYLKLTQNGMADERDVLTVISEPGYMTIHMRGGITDSMLSDKTLQGYIVDEVKSSPACRIQRDKLVQYSLVVANVNSSVTDLTKVGDFSELNSFIGEPKATYTNYSVDDAISEFQIIAISSGLTIPMDRFATAKAKVSEHKEKFEKQSALNLSNDRSATEIRGNAQTHDIIMGGSGKQEADLSFLDE